MRLFALLTLALAAIAPLQAEVDTAPLAAWLERQSEIRSVQADFIQERKLPALKKPVETPGTLSLSRPGKLRWELGKPVKTIAVSDGETMTLVDLAKNEARTLPADSPRAKQFTFLADGSFGGSLEGFTRAFELVESRVTNGIYQLTVRPKNRSLRDRAPWMFLDIDPKRDELRAFEVQLEDGSRIRTIFTRSRFNVAIPEDRFTVDLSGVKVK